MTLRKIFLILFLFYFNSSPIFADSPYFLDFKLILNQSDAGKKAQSFLKNSLDSGIKKHNEKQKKIQEEEKKIIQQKKILNRSLNLK